MNDLASYSELDAYFDNASFILKTQQQLSKDFAKFNLDFPENFDSEAYKKEEIEELISVRITDLMKEGETRLLQLLYTVDLSENQFLHLTTQPDFITKIAEKILFREAYKVFLRAKFT